VRRSDAAVQIGQCRESVQFRPTLGRLAVGRSASCRCVMSALVSRETVVFRRCQKTYGDTRRRGGQPTDDESEAANSIADDKHKKKEAVEPMYHSFLNDASIAAARTATAHFLNVYSSPQAHGSPTTPSSSTKSPRSRNFCTAFCATRM
jgi:hypothetical protein